MVQYCMNYTNKLAEGSTLRIFIRLIEYGKPLFVELLQPPASVAGKTLDTNKTTFVSAKVVFSLQQMPVTALKSQTEKSKRPRCGTLRKEVCHSTAFFL